MIYSLRRFYHPRKGKVTGVWVGMNGKVENEDEDEDESQRD
ncbi:MAG: hypothetical protein WA110_01880 [Anaerolineaceae bacterium]